MQAQKLLGQASDVELKAGNKGAWMVLNDLVLSMFQIAIGTEFDELANRAYAARYPVPLAPPLPEPDDVPPNAGSAS
jgi:hypothetical protein